MSDGGNLRDVVEDIVSSYDARIQKLESVFDTTHQLLHGFQENFLDLKQEREKVNAELRESLARNDSLRKKDFDGMMRDIHSKQDMREKEVRELLNNYLNEQKQMAGSLRENLKEFNQALTNGEAQRVGEFKEFIKKNLARQDERKEQVTGKLKEFQKEQKEMAEKLNDLLAKGRELRIKDFKAMLKESRNRNRERIEHRIERRDEVRDMLDDFKMERETAARTWRRMKGNLNHKRSLFSKT